MTDKRKLAELFDDALLEIITRAIEKSTPTMEDGVAMDAASNVLDALKENGLIVSLTWPIKH